MFTLENSKSNINIFCIGLQKTIQAKYRLPVKVNENTFSVEFAINFKVPILHDLYAGCIEYT